MVLNGDGAAPFDFPGLLTLPALLASWAERKPEHPFLLWVPHDGTDRTYSWAAFRRLGGWAEGLLREYGVTDGARFCVHMSNRPETVALLFGAAAVGATVIPTNTLLTARELAYLVTHSRSTLVITEPGLEAVTTQALDGLDGVEKVVLSEEPDAKLRGPVLSESATRDNGADVAILYTSGTTAHPKGVRISQAALINAGQEIAAGIGFTEKDRNFAALPLFHVNSLCYTIMTALLTGGSVALNDRFSASRYFDAARRSGATVGWLAATPMRMLLAQPNNLLKGRDVMRKIVFGQNLSPEEFKEWETRIAIPLQQIYGMTETVTLPLMSTSLLAHRPNAIGRAAPGVTARLMVDGRADAAPGEVGELWLRLRPVRQMMSGYLFDDEATAGAFSGEWFKTGDFMRVEGSGIFHFVDRRRDVLKVSGENISASEVEMILNAHPAVFDSAVIGLPDPLRDQTIKAFVILNAEENATPGELAVWCRSRLASFKVPSEIEIRADFPRTSVGKIQKALLTDGTG